MKKIFLIFPHQLFKEIHLLQEMDEVYLIEEKLFFTQYKFHKLKLILHRSSMKYYEQYLNEHGIRVHYIESMDERADIRILLTTLDARQIELYDVCDQWLENRIRKGCNKKRIILKEHVTPLFINTKAELFDYFGNKKKYFQTDFYILQRKKLNLLIDDRDMPIGGKWSFDTDNRKKYPRGKFPPPVNFPLPDRIYHEAVEYVEKYYSSNYGFCYTEFIYPYTHEQSETWLRDFIENRLNEFGEYEDAILGDQHFLHHSVLTPMLNIGLLQPLQIVEAAIGYSRSHPVPINSLEGFMRQIIGWREFIRGVYIFQGNYARRRNFWNFNRELPPTFYEATTGIEPIDTTIRKLLRTAYNHHIERLMILGNFMLLNELDPNAIYQWFMEMYIDAYDWVMVPNVYGMSQFADGGIMSTKPYISGSNYLLKMSNFKRGDWCEKWDALFWHFMDKHRLFFSKNPRLKMLLQTFDKMSNEKKIQIHKMVKELKS